MLLSSLPRARWEVSSPGTCQGALEQSGRGHADSRPLPPTQNYLQPSWKPHNDSHCASFICSSVWKRRRGVWAGVLPCPWCQVGRGAAGGLSSPLPPGPQKVVLRPWVQPESENGGETQPCPRVLWSAHICSGAQAVGPAGRNVNLDLDTHSLRIFRDSLVLSESQFSHLSNGQSKVATKIQSMHETNTQCWTACVPLVVPGFGSCGLDGDWREREQTEV